MVNQQFAFAVHILAMLAYSGEILDSRTIAASVNTNPVVVRRLLCALRKARLITTFTGKHGGARLAKLPQQVSLLEIFDALQVRPLIAASRHAVFKQCPVSCSMKRIMGDVSHGTDRAVRNHLRNITLDQVLRRIR